MSRRGYLAASLLLLMMLRTIAAQNPPKSNVKPDILTDKRGEHGNLMFQRAEWSILIELNDPNAKPNPQTGRYRRLDMYPPHPNRGYCLECHEP